MELRKFLKGAQADKGKVLALGRCYGKLDGEMSYYYALAFASVANTLTAQQKERLVRMRQVNPSDSNSHKNSAPFEHKNFFF